MRLRQSRLVRLRNDVRLCQDLHLWLCQGRHGSFSLLDRQNLRLLSLC